MNCSRIRNLIDEAERPDLLGYEINRHTVECEACRRFADERVRLRVLLSSPGRVAAPLSFDTVLKIKLAERKANRTLWWLTPSAYMPVAGIAAVALVFMITGQSLSPRAPTNTQTSDAGSGELPPNYAVPTPSGLSLPRASNVMPVEIGARGPVSVSGVTAAREQKLVSSRPVTRYEGRSMVSDAFLVRGKQIEVEIPHVTYGAQLPYYASAVRDAPRMERTSF